MARVYICHWLSQDEPFWSQFDLDVKHYQHDVQSKTVVLIILISSNSFKLDCFNGVDCLV